MADASVRGLDADVLSTHGSPVERERGQHALLILGSPGCGVACALLGGFLRECSRNVRKAGVCNEVGTVRISVQALKREWSCNLQIVLVAGVGSCIPALRAAFPDPYFSAKRLRSCKIDNFFLRHSDNGCVMESGLSIGKPSSKKFGHKTTRPKIQ